MPQPERQRISTDLFQKPGTFFSLRKPPSTGHDLPRNSPQLHHKTPRKKTPTFSAPLQKTPPKHQKPLFPSARQFF
jgi:hypothetical protein